MSQQLEEPSPLYLKAKEVYQECLALIEEIKQEREQCQKQYQ